MYTKRTKLSNSFRGTQFQSLNSPERTQGNVPCPLITLNARPVGTNSLIDSIIKVLHIGNQGHHEEEMATEVVNPLIDRAQTQTRRRICLLGISFDIDDVNRWWNILRGKGSHSYNYETINLAVRAVINLLRLQFA